MNMIDKKKQKETHSVKKYEYGAYFRVKDLFTKLLDLIEVIPVDRLGNDGVYFQTENNEPVKTFEKTRTIKIRKTMTCQTPYKRDFVDSFPKKCKTMKFSSTKECNWILKEKEEQYKLIEQSTKICKTQRRPSLMNRLSTNKITKRFSIISNEPIKKSTKKKYCLKTESNENTYTNNINKIMKRYHEKSSSTSQKTLTSVIKLLQKGKIKYLNTENDKNNIM